MVDRTEDCTDKIHAYAEKVYGKKIADKGSVIKFVRSMYRQADNLMEESGGQLSLNDALEQAGKERLTQLEKGLVNNKRIFEKQTIKNAQHMNQINNSSKPIDSAVEIMKGVGAAQQNWLGNMTTGSTNIGSGLVKKLKDEDLLSVAKRTENESVISKCLYDENFKNDANPRAAKAAKIIHDFYKNDVSAYFRSLGVDEPTELAGRIARTHHDNAKIFHLPLDDFIKLTKSGEIIDPKEREKIVRDKWINYIKPLLDMKKTFPDLMNNDTAQITELRKDFTQRRNRANGNFDATKEMKKSTGFVSRIAGQERSYHFKNANSWLSYQKTHGAGSLWDAISAELEATGKKLGTVSVLGPNPEAGYDFLIKQTEKNHGLDDDGETTIQWNKAKKSMNGMFALSTGQIGSAVNHTTAKVINNLMQFVNLTKMGGLLMHVMGSDIAQITKQAMTLHGANKPAAIVDGFKAIAAFMPRGMKATQDVLDALGVAIHSGMGASVNRFNLPENSGKGSMTRLAAMEFVANGVKRWDSAATGAATAGFARNLALQKGKLFKDLNPQLRAHLKVYGIDSDIWELWRKHHIDIPSNKLSEAKTLLTPDGFREVSDKDLQEYGTKTGTLTENATKEQLDFLRNSLAGNAQRMYEDYGTHIITHPDYAMRADAAIGAKNLSPLNYALNRLMFQFKGYAMSNFKKTIMPTFNRDFTRKQIATNLLMHAATLAFWGYAGYAANKLLHGESPDWSDEALDHMLPSLGYSGDLIKTLAENPRRVPQEIAGPVVNLLSNTAEFAHSMLQSEDSWTASHKNKKQIAQSFAKRNLNFVNYPYLVAAWNLAMKDTASKMNN